MVLQKMRVAIDMRELSLFTGCGGGLLGTHCLLGWQTVGYVEIDDYCQRLIKQRIKDGVFDEAPIFSDVRAFIGEGYADRYKGMVDVITAGFPCQPFSTAGKRKGEDDERNMWGYTLECICRIRPRWLLLENVTGLLTHEYIRRIFSDLAELRYDCRWDCISAENCGAIHVRKRLWIVAKSTGNGQCSSGLRQLPKRDDKTSTRKKDAAETCRHSTLAQVCKSSDTTSVRCNEVEQYVRRRAHRQRTICENREFCEQLRGAASWWETEPDMGRLADGVPDRVDRLKAIGNAQVPIVAATAWKILSGDV